MFRILRIFAIQDKDNNMIIEQCGKLCLTSIPQNVSSDILRFFVLFRESSGVIPMSNEHDSLSTNQNLSLSHPSPVLFSKNLGVGNIFTALVERRQVWVLRKALFWTHKRGGRRRNNDVSVTYPQNRNFTMEEKNKNVGKVCLY